MSRKIKIPDYSNCCHKPVLAYGNRLYCYGCKATVRSFSGKRRLAALAQLTFIPSHCRVDAMLFGQRIAYARDVPNLVWRDGSWRKVGRSTYKYFLQGCPLVSAMGWIQCQSQDGFSSLARAAKALREALK